LGRKFGEPGKQLFAQVREISDLAKLRTIQETLLFAQRIDEIRDLVKQQRRRDSRRGERGCSRELGHSDRWEFQHPPGRRAAAEGTLEKARIHHRRMFAQRSPGCLFS
jgi:hypothetical protein